MLIKKWRQVLVPEERAEAAMGGFGNRKLLWVRRGESRTQLPRKSLLCLGQRHRELKEAPENAVHTAESEEHGSLRGQ